MATDIVLFSVEENVTDATRPVIIKSIDLPHYTSSIRDDIRVVLDRLGYEIIDERTILRDRTFRYSKYSDVTSRYWHSREMEIECSADGPTRIRIYSSERRRKDAFILAKSIQDKVTQDARVYLESLHDEGFLQEALKEIPTLAIA